MVDSVIATDGGGTKTQVAVISVAGDLLGFATGKGSNAQLVGQESSTAVIKDTVRAALQVANHRCGEDKQVRVVHTAIYQSGLDLPAETEALRGSLIGEPWVTEDTVYANDIHALLRAGTSERNAVAVICGTGTNAIGIREDGKVVTFPALGEISGDWGGGTSLGQSGLWHAARALDGRGPRTRLVDVLPPVLNCADLVELIEAFHFGHLSTNSVKLLAPAVVKSADAGDEVALSIVGRQAVEIAAFVRAVVERLKFDVTQFPVVLGGGVIASMSPALIRAIEREIALVTHRAYIQFLKERPLLGAGLLALEHIEAADEVLNKAAACLTKVR